MFLIRHTALLAIMLGLLLISRRLSKVLCPEADIAVRATGALLVFFFLVTTVMTFSQYVLLGLGLTSLLAGAGYIWGRGIGSDLRESAAWLSTDFTPRVLIIVCLILFIVVFVGYALYRPVFLHDPMTYQLTFPAAWISTGKIHFWPTPFGDPSQAYAPSNPSSYYLLLMGVMRSDFYAASGQALFLVATAFAVAALAREIGVPKPWPPLAALFAALQPMVMLEARTALSDLALAVYLCAAVLFSLRAARTGWGGDLLLAAAAAGLMAGTKYNSLPWLVLLLPLLAAALFQVRKTDRRLKLHLALSVLVFAAGCGYWYVRNYALTGNPVYPFDVEIFGVTFWDGAYGRPQMLGWIYHREGWRAWWATLTGVVSPVALAAATGSVAVGAPLLLVFKKIRPLHLYVLLLPLIMDRLIWHMVPFQVDRFWTPAVVLAMVAVTAVTLFDGRAGYAALAAFLADALFRRHYWQNPYLFLADGQWMLVAALAGTALFFGLFKFSGPRLARPAAYGLPAALVVCLFALSLTHIGRRTESLLRWEYGKGWEQWLDSQDRQETIAYTGNNVPYPLFGPHLENRVLYVNVDGRKRFAFHDYAGLWGSKIEIDNPEAAVYRLQWAPASWWQSLVDQEVDYLFVTRLGRNQLVNIAHDRGGWPVEYAWAESRPEAFLLSGRNDFSRIYLIRSAAKPSYGARYPMIRPLSARAAYARDPHLAKEFFPLAPVSGR